MHLEFSKIHIAKLLILSGCTFSGQVFAQSFTDGFEASTLKPQWMITAGSVTLSTAVHHSGNQSLLVQTNSSPEANVTFALSSPATGSISVWLHGLPTPGSGVGMRIMDFSGDQWILFEQTGDTEFTVKSTLNGENDFTFSAPQLDWHHLEIQVGAAGATFKLDGSPVTFNYPTLSSFRVIQLRAGDGPGDSLSPGGSGYFDDFGLNAPTAPVYNTCLLYDPMKAVHAGATIPIKLQLCGALQNDLSAANILPLATGVTNTDTSASFQANTAGNANVGNQFRFDPSLGSTGGYIFNLKTDNLTTGNYALNFTVAGDPSVYSAPFKVE
jgi:hypothetical protein